MASSLPDRPGVVVRPPLLYVGGLALGLALDAIWPASIEFDGARRIAGAALMALGAALLGGAIYRFHAAGTNVPTWKPATALVTDGLYRLSRNPIYVALSAIYAGVALLANSAWILAFLAPILLVVRYGIIAREEVYLERKFGDVYRDYKRAVRRWL